MPPEVTVNEHNEIILPFGGNFSWDHEEYTDLEDLQHIDQRLNGTRVLEEEVLQYKVIVRPHSASVDLVIQHRLEENVDPVLLCFSYDPNTGINRLLPNADLINDCTESSSTRDSYVPQHPEDTEPLYLAYNPGRGLVTHRPKVVKSVLSRNIGRVSRL